MENSDLVEKLRIGDRHAVKLLYESAFTYCSKIVLNNNGSMNDAKDLFQEAMIVLFKNLRKKDFSLNCNVKTYLYSVMRNLWLKELNKTKISADSYSLNDEHNMFVSVDEEELQHKNEIEVKHNLVADAIQKIKEDCRNLLMSYYFKKQSLKDVAVQMNFTYQFIKVKKNRCMEKLKSEVRLLQGN